MKLLEYIANGKRNRLDFGDDLVFFRGEIHLIKLIGDQPGVSSIEVARLLNVTRAVISKTLKKLESGGFVEKKYSSVDQKRKSLFLSEKGKTAYEAHKIFHEQNDSDIYAFLEGLTEREIAVIRQFLTLAHEMVSRHF